MNENIEDLKQEGLLIKTEEKKITQPFGDRSKAVIEPMLTDQWFVDTQKIVEPAIIAVKTGETRIYPKQDEKVYFHWLENIEPWCISRQLWWGHRIPVWTLNQEKLPDHPAAASNATTQLHRMLDGLADFKKADRLSIKQEEENGKIT